MSEINCNIIESIIYKNNEEEVKIIDNFFSDYILQEIIKHFNNIIWKCQCISDTNISVYSGDSPYWRIELEKDEFFNSYIKNIIENYLNKIIILKRIYAVGQMFTQDSVFHIDDENKNTLTVCFYINTIIKNDGLFHLKIPNKKHIISIEPLMNRLVLFPSFYRHKGTGFGRFNDSLRICIAWKFQLI
jgi:hypothetical protein